MPHAERHAWVKEISDINRRINEGKGEGGGRPSVGPSPFGG